MAEGQKLAQKYCSTCHLPVEPSLLDKETWKNQVLPAMAKQLGLEVWQNNHYFQNEKSSISQGDWMKIIAYYDSLAPVKLPQTKAPTAPKNDWAIFSLKSPKNDTNFIATTTLVSINNKDHNIYTNSSENPDLFKWDSNLNKTLAAKLPSPAVNVLFSDNRNILTLIGEMKALDIPNGEIIQLDNTQKSTSITSNLIRPIQTLSADFNKDGSTDYVVCSFGHNKGGLYLLKQLPENKFEKTPIREIAGATQAITGDFNKDGWPDIMALFAHADEGIWIFLNDQKGGFKTENILRFPPVFGSSSFQLADMNKDGNPDIIYTAGDNSDYSRILKPYHGVYIYINTGNFNEGNLHFKKTYFYPLHGATKVIAKDFDRDGDIDLATISFFADFQNNPSGSFLYFEQNTTKTSLNFIPHAMPINKLGRWICMDAEDMDGDGDQDLVLGNYSKGFLNQENFKPDWDVHVPFIILENKRF
ncbi:FG-GAP repeat domain-containing protein [Dyadobacter subterraneus]|uniref:VCBS repeat-containing protein n=1 Tax=Dyadobacter subterraneus TaxID=2773304 RepID=A0ABR9W6I2_9BACT|nr:VCBS repeat-containing protein [Dyadobacter subterraneus]MBE9461069.1 VCBS repeat-containing protein [Dyadobacter subterraneus]